MGVEGKRDGAGGQEGKLAWYRAYGGRDGEGVGGKLGATGAGVNELLGVKFFKVVEVFGSWFEGNGEGMDMMRVVGDSNGVVMVDQSESKIELLALGSEINVGGSLEGCGSNVG